MRILCTGNSGFIGSHICDRLIELGHTVFGVDNMSWGFAEDINPSVRWFRFDILNTELLESTLRDCEIDLVIHCAASLEVTKGQDNPIEDLRINTEGTISVLEAMRKSGVKELINFSSACVYGKGKIGQEPSTTNKTNPHWSYGSSKLAAEIYCNQYTNTYGIHVVHIRPGIVCGPREWYGRALTIFIKRALERKEIVIFGDGSQERDFIHVDDVVSIVTSLIREREEIGFLFSHTLNAGTRVATSINKLAMIVSVATGASVKFEEVNEGEYSNLIEGRIRLPFEMQSMRLENLNSRQILGQDYFFKSLQQIVQDEINWYANNKARWDTKWKV